MDSRPFVVPRDRHYDRASHVWAKPREDRVLVGIDTIGLESLGDLAFVALQPVGTTVIRGEPIGTLEAAKMTTAIAAPVSGTVVSRNEAVLRDPLIVNRDPYRDGWLVEIAPSDWAREAVLLISGDAIPQWAAAETERWSGA